MKAKHRHLNPKIIEFFEMVAISGILIYGYLIVLQVLLFGA